MLKLETIDGTDVLTFKMGCGCAISSAFPHTLSSTDTALMLIEFSKAVYDLPAIHVAAHDVAKRMAESGIDPTPEGLSEELGVKVKIVTVKTTGKAH